VLALGKEDQIQSNQGVAGGEKKACKRGRLRDQGPRHDATAMELSLRVRQSRDGGLGQDQRQVTRWRWSSERAGALRSSKYWKVSR
jgi:hypothetical protein